MKFNITLLLILGLLFIQCKDQPNNNLSDSNTKVDHHKKDHKNKHHDHSDSKHHDGNEINQHMHDTPVAELIKRFESPERDEYQQPELVLDYIGDINNQTILDIGAGSGYFSIKMAERGANVIAGDVNDEFLEYMQQRLLKNPIKAGKMVVRKLPFDHPTIKENEVDKAIIVNTYHHIEKREEYFKNVYDGIKPGGELIVIDFFKKELPIGPGIDHKFSEEEVMNELKTSGFEHFKVESKLLEMQYIIRAIK